MDGLQLREPLLGPGVFVIFCKGYDDNMPFDLRFAGFDPECFRSTTDACFRWLIARLGGKLNADPPPSHEMPNHCCREINRDETKTKLSSHLKWLFQSIITTTPRTNTVFQYIINDCFEIHHQAFVYIYKKKKIF